MAVISIKDVVLRFGDEALFDGITLHIEEGDKLCLLGRNGAGKSTLLRLMAGGIQPDSGATARNRQTRIVMLSQDFHRDFTGSCLDFCLTPDAGEAPSDNHSPDEVDCRKYLTKLGMDPQDAYESLSGGGRRRVMLARCLALNPDVLLLDEPTNHLDIDSVLWLEDHLSKQVKTLVLITHDRAFAKAVGNRVAEIDRGQLYSFDCGYEEFLRRREELLEAETKQQALFDKRLAAEEAWLRRGVKARRTRDEGRVKSLLAMREQYRQRRNRQGQVSLTAHSSGASGDLVAEVKNLSFRYPDSPPEDPPVIQDLTTTIMRGDRVGIVGPNGAGKTTLVKLLLGKLLPTSGSVRLGTNIAPIYFDQMRSSIDPKKNLIENLSGGDDSVVVGGKLKHLNAYLQDFLFSPDRAKSPVEILSGGEQNRLMLAKLFTQNSNLLVLDEPTNDLDMETLDLLEEMLANYAGTILLVSHDREFLDNIVTDCLVFTPQGTIQEFVGGYSDWRNSYQPPPTPSKEKSAPPAGHRPSDRKDKLSFKEKRELETLPDTISSLEGELERLHTLMADPDFYRSSGEQVAEVNRLLEETQSSLDRAYSRWEHLDARAE